MEQTEVRAIQYLMTSSSSANVTRLHIVNQSSTAQTFTGTLYNPEGKQLGPADQELSTSPVRSKGRLVLTSVDVEILFGVQPWRGPAILEVTGSGAFDLISRLTSPSGLVSNTNCVRGGYASSIGGFDSPDMTFIRLINTTDQNIGPITGTLYDLSGEVVGTTDVQLSAGLNPKQAIWINRNKLGDLVGDTWNGEATLDVEGIDGLKLLNLNLINNDTFLNFSCYELGVTQSLKLACSEPRPEACTQEFNPVCAERDNGVRCVTTPCPSIEWETYSNGCTACSDPLVFAYYQGSCEKRLLTD